MDQKLKNWTLNATNEHDEIQRNVQQLPVSEIYTPRSFDVREISATVERLEKIPWQQGGGVTTKTVEVDRSPAPAEMTMTLTIEQ